MSEYDLEPLPSEVMGFPCVAITSVDVCLEHPHMHTVKCRCGQLMAGDHLLRLKSNAMMLSRSEIYICTSSSGSSALIPLS